MTKSMSCSTSRIVTPSSRKRRSSAASAASRRGAVRRRARRAAAAPDRGTARARSRRCAAGRAAGCPPAGAASSARPTRASWRAASPNSRASSARSSREIAVEQRRPRPRRCAPIATFSITDHAGHQLHVLEAAGDARAARCGRAQAGDTLAEEARLRPALGARDAGEQVERRALARAVRADQPDDLAGARARSRHR